jgi:hypothetical protein
MTTPNHLQIYNPRHEALRTLSPSCFPQFGRLPPELRRAIWSFCLPGERFLRVQLESVLDADGNPIGERGNEIVEYFSLGYTLRVNGRRILSKLLHVDAEARKVAQDSYPIKLPCVYDDGTPGTFYFNPELDILWLKRGNLSKRRTIPFLRDLVASDPKGVGLRHLALGLNDIGLLKDISLAYLSENDKHTLQKVMSNLDDMYYLSIENAGRVHMGPYSGESIPISDHFENRRAKPIMACVPSFTRLHVDPRLDIDRDLIRVFAGIFDPRCMIWQWNRIRRQWQVPVEEGRTKHHFLVSHGGYFRAPVIDRESAQQWLQEEHREWLQGQEYFRSLVEAEGLTVPIESDEDLQNVTRSAAGFWIFPIQAVGEPPPPDTEKAEAFELFQSKRVLDLREYRPQLCLADLP